MSIFLILVGFFGTVFLICLLSGAVSYYNEEEFFTVAAISFVITILLIFFWFITDNKQEEKKKQDVQIEQQEENYYEMIYTKFIKKFNLTEEDFKRIDGETKPQLVTRIRSYLDINDLEQKPKEKVEDVAAKDIQVEDLKDTPVEKVVKKPEDPDFKFKMNW